MKPHTFEDIAHLAPELVETYCSRSGPFAWPLYDEDESPKTLTGADLTAPALLSYPIKGKYLNLLGQGAEDGETANDYRVLYSNMQSFIAAPVASNFHGLDRDVVEALTADEYHHDGAPDDWRAFVRCLESVQKCPGLTSVAVTKILHRKRPNLVPIKDSLVRDFYGAGRSYATLFLAIYDDLQNNFATLRDMAQKYTTPLGRPMTELRALDISVWMYMQDPAIAAVESGTARRN